jgi:acyl carrier protein
MSTTNEEKQIIDWLQARWPSELDDDFDLVEHRVIDSLRFMEFFCLLQEITGRELELDGLTLHHFRTLRAIRTTFLTDSVAPGAMEELVL